jgi:hypothetical protein
MCNVDVIEKGGEACRRRVHQRSIHHSTVFPKPYIHTRENGGLARTTTTDIDQIVAALKDQPRMVLHFHGDLVPEGNGTAAAASLLPGYRSAGAYPSSLVEGDCGWPCLSG